MRILIALAILMFPFATLGAEPDVHSWVCTQPGYMFKTKAYAVTHVFKAPAHDYDVKEEIFEEVVHDKTEGQFDPGMDSSCRDFTSSEKAEKYLKFTLRKADEREYSILWIDFGGLGE